MVSEARDYVTSFLAFLASLFPRKSTPEGGGRRISSTPTSDREQRLALVPLPRERAGESLAISRCREKKNPAYLSRPQTRNRIVRADVYGAIYRGIITRFTSSPRTLIKHRGDFLARISFRRMCAVAARFSLEGAFNNRLSVVSLRGTAAKEIRGKKKGTCRNERTSLAT